MFFVRVLISVSVFRLSHDTELVFLELIILFLVFESAVLSEVSPPKKLDF